MENCSILPLLATPSVEGVAGQARAPLRALAMMSGGRRPLVSEADAHVNKSRPAIGVVGRAV